MTEEEKEKLIELSDLNREDNIKYISSEAQGIAITLNSDSFAPSMCKLERAYICGRRKSEKRIIELEKENAELKAKIYGGGYKAVITKKDADIILLEHLLKEQKELHKSVCNQLTHTHRNLRNQLTYAETIIQDLLDNTDEYARQRAEDFLKE